MLEEIFLESEKQIQNHCNWVDYIVPIFLCKFGLKYRYEYEIFYSEEKNNFLANERNVFNKLNEKK